MMVPAYANVRALQIPGGIHDKVNRHRGTQEGPRQNNEDPWQAGGDLERWRT